MKTNITKLTIALCTAALFVGVAGRMYADDNLGSEKQRTFSGNIKSVDEKERTIAVETFWSTKTFTAGDHCAVQMEDKPVAMLKDLRPGNHVEVNYVMKDGVKVASRISQKDATFTGHISAIDPVKRTFVVRSGLTGKTFVAADDCKIVIRNEGSRGLSDLKIGHKVTVRYASTMQGYLAHKVDQNSLVFSGTVEAVDVTTDTVKAKQFLVGRKFKLGDDCPIIINGMAGGKLSDLRIGDQLLFNYEDVDGVLIANRISRESSPQKSDPDQFTRTE